MVRAVFGETIGCAAVEIRRRKWWPLQPAHVVMAPCGHIHFPPKSPHYRADFSMEPPRHQAFFLHEMTHVWQAQTKGRWYLPTRRHPFCRYRYRLVPGQPFAAYGIEQQAEIVSDLWLARHGLATASGADLAGLEAIIAFSN